MTKRKFIKQLRALGLSEPVIRNYANMVSKLGGKVSYKDVFNKLMGYLCQRITYEYICGNEQPKLDLVPYELNFNYDMENYLMHYCYGAKILDTQMAVIYTI